MSVQVHPDFCNIKSYSFSTIIKKYFLKSSILFSLQDQTSVTSKQFYLKTKQFCQIVQARRNKDTTSKNVEHNVQGMWLQKVCLQVQYSKCI